MENSMYGHQVGDTPEIIAKRELVKMLNMWLKDSELADEFSETTPHFAERIWDFVKKN